jgi:hypothetical protein
MKSLTISNFRKRSVLIGMIVGSISANFLVSYIGSENIFPWTKMKIISDNFYDAKSKKDLIDAAEKANSLVDEIDTSETKATVNSSERQLYLSQSSHLREAFAEKYMNMASIIENKSIYLVQLDLKMIAPTKELIYALREVATQSRKIDYKLPKIYPQDIYLRKSDVNRKDVFENIAPDSRKKIDTFKRLLQVKNGTINSKQAALIIKEVGKVYQDQAKIIAIRSPSFVKAAKETGTYFIDLADDVENNKSPIPNDL